MPSEPRTYEPAGGDGLFFIIATAVIVVVAAEAAFIAFASWWLMLGVLFGAIVACVAVVTALLRLMSDGTPVARPQPQPRVEAELATARPRRTPRAVPTPSRP
jgi:hypothetical protein